MKGWTLLAATLAALTLSSIAHAEDDATCQASYVAGQRKYKLEHDLVGGREQLLVCAKTCPDELRASCGRWLASIDTEMPSIVVKALDAAGHDVLDAAIAVDGTPLGGYIEGTPIELNPGQHTLRVSRAGRAPVEQTILLHVGEKLRVADVWTEPPAKPTGPRRPVPAAAYVLAAVGAAGLASFGVFAIWTTVEYDQTSGCSPTCTSATRDASFTTKTVVADASLGVAAAALVGAAAVYLLRPTVGTGIVRGSIVSPWVERDAMGLAWSARF